MYESPIDIITHNIQIQMEKEIVKAVQQCDIHVDKDELIKALLYDRNQYDRGYKDGLDVLDKIRAEIEELDIYYDNDYFSTNNCPMYKCNDVLQIIDKYREGESE